jgi:MiaB/RimO family radical SAM methylthiotransferase
MLGVIGTTAGPRAASDPGERDGLIRVSTGCRNRCSFCAIPFAAGATMSRRMPDILDDVRLAVAGGIADLHLTSEDVGAYGQDFGTNFVELVREVVRVPGVTRVFLDTLQPRWLYRYLTDFCTSISAESLGDTLYVPMESGSDRILGAMARGYTIAEYAAIVSRLHSRFPEIKLASDVIVGFPGESEDDFRATQDAVREFAFDFVEVFAFTPRHGTKAATLPNQVPVTVRGRRARQLIADVLGERWRRLGITDSSSVMHDLRTRTINTNIDLVSSI